MQDCIQQKKKQAYNNRRIIQNNYSILLLFLVFGTWRKSGILHIWNAVDSNLSTGQYAHYQNIEAPFIRVKIESF